jgi:hypothetical protein
VQSARTRGQVAGALHLPGMNGQEVVACVRVPVHIAHCWRCALGRCARRWKPREAGDRDMPGGPAVLRARPGRPSA